MIPLCVSDIGREEIKAVTEVLRSGWLVHGPKTEQFEKEFSKYIGVKQAVALNSCTSALQLVIQAHELRGEIIVPSFTFVASVNAIVNTGCKPVFADIDCNTCNIDADKIEEKINDSTVAIMPVHYAGQSCRMDRIMSIAQKYNLVVIEDSAETIGGEFKGQKTGSFGIGCFSFFPTKNMTCAEGGMVTTNDKKIAEKIRTYASHGILKSTLQRTKDKVPGYREAILPGYNYRMTDIQAAIGLVQLKKLDRMNELRVRHARYLSERLESENIEVPKESKDCKHVFQMYTIRVKGIDRNRFVLKLKEKGISASVHFYPPVHLQKYYKENLKCHHNLAITEKVANSIVTLPMYPQLTKRQLNEIVRAVNSVVKGLKDK